jgi:hypothetical protein
MAACLNNNVGAVRALIERGAPCDSVDPADNCAAIHNAILNNTGGSHMGVARELLTNPHSAAATRASLALCQPPGLPALFRAAVHNQLEMLELLLEHGATIPETAVGPEHPLHRWGDCEPAMITATQASLRDTAYALMYSSWSNQMYSQHGSRVGEKNLAAARHQGRVIDLMLRHCPPTSSYVRNIVESLPRPRSTDGMVATGSLTCGAAGCTEVGTTKCGACKEVCYCSRGCQKAHWKAHKEDCGQRCQATKEAIGEID